jgi:hypothetical protein
MKGRRLLRRLLARAMTPAEAPIAGPVLSARNLESPKPETSEFTRDWLTYLSRHGADLLKARPHMPAPSKWCAKLMECNM